MQLKKQVNRIISSIASHSPSSSLSSTSFNNSTFASSAIATTSRAVVAETKEKLEKLKAKLKQTKENEHFNDEHKNNSNNNKNNNINEIFTVVGSSTKQRIYSALKTTSTKKSHNNYNVKRGSRWQLLENDLENIQEEEESEPEDVVQDGDNENEGKKEIVHDSVDYFQINRNQVVVVVDDINDDDLEGKQIKQQIQSSTIGQSQLNYIEVLPTQSSLSIDSNHQNTFSNSFMSSTSKLQGYNNKNTNFTKTEEPSSSLDVLYSSQQQNKLQAVVQDGVTTLLANNKILDLYLRQEETLQNQKVEDESIANIIQDSKSKDYSSKNKIIRGMLRSALKIKNLKLKKKKTEMLTPSEMSIDTSVSNHNHHHFDVKQSKLIKSARQRIRRIGRVRREQKDNGGVICKINSFENSIEEQQQGKENQVKNHNRNNGNGMCTSSSSAVVNSATSVVTISQLKSRRKLIFKSLKKSGVQVGKALKVGFTSMGNSMIPQHYILPSPYELPSTNRSWEDEHSYYSKSRQPYWREYEMYDQYEYDRRRYHSYFAQLREKNVIN